MMQPNTWYPIGNFDFTAQYAEGNFLVSLPGVPGDDFAPCFQEAWIEDGRFVGTWRYMCHEDQAPLEAVNALEPTGFMLIGAPDF